MSAESGLLAGFGAGKSDTPVTINKISNSS